MKRILITAILIMLVLTAAIPLYAEDSSVAVTEASAAVITAPATITDTGTLAHTSAAVPMDTPENEQSFADELLDKIIAKLPEILSALSVIMTAVLCLVAKGTLLPALSEGLTKVANISRAGADKCAELSDAAQKRLDEITRECEEAKRAGEKTAALAERTSLAVENLTASEADAERDREIVKEVMLAQAEIFASLVQSSSLPQWKKDVFEKRFTEQKETIASLAEKKESDET